VTKEELIKVVSGKLIENCDLSELDLNGMDLSGCEINNVIFAKGNQKGREIDGLIFNNSKISNSSFEGAEIKNCDFDGSGTVLKSVSFKKCVMLKCRFRKSALSWCDFRYAEINSATFEEARIDFCDFYRAFLVGVIIFRKAKISNSSLFYTYFDEGAAIRMDNIAGRKLLQQDEPAYRKFLVEWNTYGTGVRNNEQNRISDWSPDSSLKARFADAEDIYKTLNGLWMSKGYLADANWAYVMGRKMERKRMIADLKSGNDSPAQKLKLFMQIFWNLTSDLMFGYGESILKMIISYVVVIFIFAYFYYLIPEISLFTYDRAVEVSLKNMVAMSSDEVTGISPLVDFLNVLQTTIGILITGIFGFILGNKIRNQ
jgi:uncharacterized protein YjbI with pentapeptide repeats